MRTLTGLPMRSSGSFYTAIWVFVGVICVAVPLFAAADWTENRLRLEWRNYLTQVCLLYAGQGLDPIPYTLDLNIQLRVGGNRESFPLLWIQMKP